jgi:lipopolysaccharide export system protein LptA
MKRSRYRSIPLILALSLLSAHWASAQSLQSKDEKLNNGPITITSNTLEIDNNREIVIFTGQVDARQNELIINCQKMLLYYNNPDKEKASGNLNLKIDKIVATGNVKITRPDGAFATAEKAVYYQGDEKVVLTGKPIVKQGNDFVEGTRITLYLKEQRSIVEGSEEKKVRAVISPRSKKR